ncbi:MAG: hypothetical protein U0U69_01705 [Acidimicrobiia bacterium]
MLDVNSPGFTGLRPAERRILRWREGLVDGRTRAPDEIGDMFRRSAAHIDLVERLARWKLQVHDT